MIKNTTIKTKPSKTSQKLASSTNPYLNTLREMKVTSSQIAISLSDVPEETEVVLSGDLTPVYGDFTNPFVTYDSTTGKFTFVGSGSAIVHLNYLLDVQSGEGSVDVKLYMTRALTTTLIGSRTVYVIPPEVGGTIPYNFEFEDGDILYFTYIAPETNIVLADNYPAKAVDVRVIQLIGGTSIDTSNYYTKDETNNLFGNYYTKDESNNVLAGYYTQEQVNNLFTDEHQAQYGSLTKRVNSDFNLTTNLMALTGKPVTPFDGMKIFFKLPSTTPYNWQDKLNPLVYVDGKAGIPIVNAVWFYADNTLTDLDKNTLTAGLNTLTYDAENNVWAYSNGEFTVGQFYVFGNEDDMPGFLRMQGVDVGSQDDYPTYPGIFNKIKPNLTLDFSDTAIVGNSENSPSYEVTAGQIQNMTGDLSLSANPDGLAVIAQWNANGIFSQNVVEGANLVVSNGQATSGTATLVSFDASKVVKTGTETLTKRYALTYFFKL